jgi:DNA polymerase, archaea type
VVRFQDQGWDKNVPYLAGATHIDLGKTYALQNVETIYDGLYTGNSLGDVSEGLLGKEKLGDGSDIDTMTPEERRKYVAWDSELTLDLSKYDNFRIMKVMSSIAQKAKLSLSETCHSTVGYWWSTFITTEGYASKLPGKLKKEKYPGARVLDAEPGFYRQKTVVFDFGSMYPSIMKKYKLSPELVCCTCCNTDLIAKVPDMIMNTINTWLQEEGLPSRKDHYWICRKREGVIPTIIAGLIEEKRRYKQEGNKPMETATKLYLNSLYGLFGESQFTHSDYRVAELTTTYGKMLLGDMEQMAIQYGYEVIGGDTDSIMVINEKTPEQRSLLLQALK